MYLWSRSFLGQAPVPPRTAPITSGPEFDAERADFERERRRFELAKKEHEKRLAPVPVGTLPLEVLKRAGVKTSTRVDAKTASLLQSVLERSRVLRPYIEVKLRRIMIPAKFVHHDSDAEFNYAYTNLHKIVVPIGSSAEKELITKRGFYHPGTDSIHLRPAANVGHALHEAIHKFASRGFRNLFGGFLDEGVTQYFTDLVLAEQELAPGGAYENELRCAKHLALLFTPDIVARAYFQGDQTLANAMVRRLGIGLGQLHLLRTGDTLCKRLLALRP